MDTAGHLIHAVSSGIAGIVGGAIHALGAAARAFLTGLQVMLPGPWLPIVSAGILAIIVRGLVRR
ncbi:MAG: hypothetical protein ABIQ17_06280 [Candidatus Limnocylindrales bacterium]